MNPRQNVPVHHALIAASALMVCLLATSQSCKTPPTQSTPPDTTHHGIDTTSHNFTWRLDTIGAQGSFNDVFIISDSDAWAVGQYFVRDSTGGIDGVHPYNAAHWNGHTWEMKRIFIALPPRDSSPHQLDMVFGFASNDVWFSDGGAMVHWNGRSFVTVQFVPKFLTGGVRRMWGNSSADFYLGGTKGMLLHCVDGVYTTLSSPTTLDIQDIWGSRDSIGELEILAVASEPFSTVDRAILAINGNAVHTISDSSIAWALGAVWFRSGKKYIVAGSGIYEKRLLSDTGWRNGPLDVTIYYTYGLRGNDTSDIVAAGGYGDIVHYNGVSWRDFGAETRTAGNYGRIDMKNNFVLAVGDDGFRALIAVGKR
jgi:hypothetical protein